MLRSRLWRLRRGQIGRIFLHSIDRPRPTPKPYPRAPCVVKPIAAHNVALATAPYNGATSDRTDCQLASFQEISTFLAEVERRAYKQAMFALRDEHSALAVVQDAMLKLTEKYSEKPIGELPMLFQRILQNV